MNWWIFAAVFIAICLIGRCSPKDDTDPPDGRSGLGLRVDHRTGCHYLTTVHLFGETSITPRMDGDGKQVCEDRP